MYAIRLRLSRAFIRASRGVAAIAFALVAISSVRAAEEGMSINLGAEHVSESFGLGDHHARLDLTLARTARVWLAGNRVWIALKAENPELTNKLLAALRSTSKTGFTFLARNGTTEISLGNVRGISLRTDVNKAVWLRATTHLRQRTAGITTVGDKLLTAKLEPSVSGHALIFVVKTLAIEGVPDSVSRSLAHQVQPLRFDLPDCAQGLRFEQLTFAEKENAISLNASVNGSDLFSLLPCLMGMK